MSDVQTSPFALSLPEARVLDQGSGRERTRGGTIWSLPPADEWRLKKARESFIEANVDDFDVQGKDFVDKATGKVNRLERSDPSVGGDPRDSGIEIFFKTWDERLVFLKPRGSEGRVTSVHIGNYSPDGSRA